MRIASCRSCGEPILWAEMPSGRMCPFDVEPTPAGEWAIDDTTPTPTAARIVKSTGSGEDGFTSHFSTCPQAAEHRRRR